MSEERRKLWLYLYPDEPHQKSAIATIEAVPQRQRPDFFRDSLVAGIALSKVDPRLPALLALLLDGDGDTNTLMRVLRLVVPEIDTDLYENGTALVAVAWQKRMRDVLRQDKPWSPWFAISLDEYEQRLQSPEEDIQVRALLAPPDAETPAFLSSSSSLRQKEQAEEPISETLNNAKKMFGGSSHE